MYNSRIFLLLLALISELVVIEFLANDRNMVQIFTQYFVRAGLGPDLNGMVMNNVLT
jgi:hypothetical protein